MQKQKAIEKLTQKLHIIDDLINSSSSYNFGHWRRNTRITIEKIFGINSREVSEFDNLDLGSYPSVYTSDSYYEEDFQAALCEAQNLLKSMIDQLEDDLDECSIGQVSISNLEIIETICNRFNLVAKQLTRRHDNRDTLKITDEYDVQDLFHALLTIHFDDIRPEEWTPSYAGGASRTDFLLKHEQIVIEIKKTRPGLADNNIGQQLIIDISRYKNHPDCKQLICFVYDPDGIIRNPRGLENDLSKITDGLDVKVFIRPK